MVRECLQLKAPAKINLFLRVIGRRADGYHLLLTLMQKVDLFDEIELRACDVGIRLRSRGGGVPETRDNLVYRAAELFLQALRVKGGLLKAGVDIALTKKIPVAAGLGGGSSDAAATLKGLNELYRCGYSADELAEMGLRLGADVPFFLAKAPAALATGIGEILQPVEPLQGQNILLVNPGFAVSTRWVYRNFALTERGDSSILKNSQEVAALTSNGYGHEQGNWERAVPHNDLESVTIAKYPEIERIKTELVANGASVALMSGSGPTVFGLFGDPGKAAACHAFFKRRFHHVYLVSPVGEK